MHLLEMLFQGLEGLRVFRAVALGQELEDVFTGSIAVEGSRFNNIDDGCGWKIGTGLMAAFFVDFPAPWPLSETHVVPSHARQALSR